mmetsp:Transcript_43919/g.101520  ORF Transcript_43919/g.101520 Transcript_43919/m.101520 type:complete len:206 (+) Transcript_43919:3877-4494(+)
MQRQSLLSATKVLTDPLFATRREQSSASVTAGISCSYAPLSAQLSARSPIPSLPTAAACLTRRTRAPGRRPAKPPVALTAVLVSIFGTRRIRVSVVGSGVRSITSRRIRLERKRTDLTDLSDLTKTYKPSLPCATPVLSSPLIGEGSSVALAGNGQNRYVPSSASPTKATTLYCTTHEDRPPARCITTINKYYKFNKSMLTLSTT